MIKSSVEIIQLDPLLLSAKQAAALCSVSARTWATWISTGRTPPSIKLNGRRLWRYDLLKRWVEENCPNIERFMALLEAEK